ncbi:WD repeat-containing protein 44 [Tritrichomonas musculus]|uniref:WD repeat-containing protein 44 n=1 Tax=Tritrichomonas musculus TaxID=1915356 RepID=A0ABR2JDS1_9EUKA
MINVPSTYIDPALSITDLDTGQTYSLRDIENSTAILQSVKNSTNKKNILPNGVNFSMFFNLIQPDTIPDKLSIIDLAYPHSNSITNIAIYKDSDVIATSDSSGSITTLVGFEVNKTVAAHSAKINSLDFSSDGHLISASNDKTAKFWKRNLARPISTLRHDGPVYAARFYPNDPNNTITCSGKEVIFWNARREVIIHTLQFLSEPTALDFSQDGKLIIVGCRNGYCYIYELESMLYVSQFACGLRKKTEIIPKSVLSVAFGPENIIVSTSDHRVRLYDQTNYRFIRKYISYAPKNGDEPVTSVSFSKDGTFFLITNKKNGRAYVYPVDTPNYFKKSALVQNMKDDSSSTFFGFTLGDEYQITASLIENDSFSFLIGDSAGRLYRIR